MTEGAPKTHEDKVESPTDINLILSFSNQIQDMIKRASTPEEAREIFNDSMVSFNDILTDGVGVEGEKHTSSDTLAESIKSTITKALKERLIELEKSTSENGASSDFVQKKEKADDKIDTMSASAKIAPKAGKEVKISKKKEIKKGGGQHADKSATELTAVQRKYIASEGVPQDFVSLADAFSEDKVGKIKEKGSGNKMNIATSKKVEGVDPKKANGADTASSKNEKGVRKELSPQTLSDDQMHAFYTDLMRRLDATKNKVGAQKIYKDAETFLHGKKFIDEWESSTEEAIDRQERYYRNFLIDVHGKVEEKKRELDIQHKIEQEIEERNRDYDAQQKSKRGEGQSTEANEDEYVSKKEAQEYEHNGYPLYNEVDSFLHSLEKIANEDGLTEQRLNDKIEALHKRYGIEGEILTIPEAVIMYSRKEGRYKRVTLEQWQRMVNRFTRVQEKLHQVWGTIRPGTRIEDIMNIEIGGNTTKDNVDADTKKEEKKTNTKAINQAPAKPQQNKITRDMNEVIDDDGDIPYHESMKRRKGAVIAADFEAKKDPQVVAPESALAPASKSTQPQLPRISAKELFGNDQLPENTEFINIETALNDARFVRFLATLDKNPNLHGDSAELIEKGYTDSIKEKYELYIKSQVACAGVIDMLKVQIEKTYDKAITVTPEIEGFVRDYFAQSTFESPHEVLDIYHQLQERAGIPKEIAVMEETLAQLIEKYGGEVGIKNAYKEIDEKAVMIKGLQEESDKLVKMLDLDLDPKYGNDWLYDKHDESKSMFDGDATYLMSQKDGRKYSRKNFASAYFERSAMAAQIIGAGDSPGKGIDYVFSPSKVIRHRIDSLRHQIHELSTQNANRTTEINKAQSNMQNTEAMKKHAEGLFADLRNTVLQVYLPYKEINEQMMKVIAEKVEASIDPNKATLDSLEKQQQETDDVATKSESSDMSISTIDTSLIQDRIDIAFKKRAEKEIEEQIRKANGANGGKKSYDMFEKIIQKIIYGKDRKARRFGTKQGEEAKQVIIDAIRANMQKKSISPESRILLSGILSKLNNGGIPPELPKTTTA